MHGRRNGGLGPGPGPAPGPGPGVGLVKTSASDGDAGSGLPDWVARQYYRHGLFCASYPKVVLLISTVGFLWTCLPLFTMPIYSGEIQVFQPQAQGGYPHWMLDKDPKAYVQQVFMKATIQPYRKEELIRTDAFRAPIATAFKLHLEDLLAFQDDESQRSTESECLRTDGISAKYKTSQGSRSEILQEYGCLILSPANLWRRDPVAFQMDSNIISTIFTYQKANEGHSCLADLLFGMRQRETGITRFPVRNRQRIITYGVTVVFKKHHPGFIDALRSHLRRLYPLSTGNSSAYEDITFLFFPTRSYATEFLPFFFTLLMLFSYVYYSCKKIDMVYSKVGIAFCAAMTVLGAIMLAIALSGLTLNMSTKMCVVPYVITFIALENLMVITRSVASTQAHLDVKIRVAQGLAREGWNITRTLLTEITILTICFFIGIVDPSIQEFCHVLVMGLISDFFLQTFFFTSVLSLDMNRTGLRDVVRRPLYRRKEIFQCPISGPGLKRTSSDHQTNVVAPHCSKLVKNGEPKRVRFINFWAKRRLIQRMFSLCMIVWISLFVYQTSLLESVMKALRHDPPPLLVDSHGKQDTKSGSVEGVTDYQSALNISEIISTLDTGRFEQSADDSQVSYKKLAHVHGDYWMRLPASHWLMLFGIYNHSITSEYIAMLPPIHLSVIINPEKAKQLRHPLEERQAAAEAALHSAGETKAAVDIDDDTDDVDDMHMEEAPELGTFVPTTPGELFLIALLSLPSLTFLTYCVMALYKCLCSRNYAEWRASWNSQPETKQPADLYTQIVQESMPISIDAHRHDVENIAISETGNMIISLGLEGHIKMWDSYSGQQIAVIDRSRYFQAASEETVIDDTVVRASAQRSCHEQDTSSLKSFEINTNFYHQTRWRSGDRIKIKSIADGQSVVNTKGVEVPTVWSMDCNDRHLVLGCGNGQLEVWDARLGSLMVVYNDYSEIGVTHVKLIGNKLVAARIVGSIEFFLLNCIHFDDNRIRHSLSDGQLAFRRGSAEVTLRFIESVRAHQQPVNCLEIGGGKILTGSMDHTIRIFRLEDHFNVFTFHGHCGPITCAFIDPAMDNSAGSGSQDGMICVWDLLTGACTYSILAHDGQVLSLTHSPSYVISMGADAKICVWERFQGHLINSILLTEEHHCFDIGMLTHNLMATSCSDSIIVWDARLPDPVKYVRLGGPSETNKVKMLRHFGDTVVCSFGNQIRIVHFPLLSDKKD